MDRLIVKNFQSLRSADIEFGRLTVIVGPSSVGKSAVLRAVRALVSNIRGSDYVSRGEKAAGISARLGSVQVSLLRGDGVGKYQLVNGSQEKVFTKLAGGVPEEVTAVLNIKPVKDEQSINFSGQFDRPFLLTESGAAVARVLGELTNVSAILEAAREGNRRRNVAQSTLRTRQADLAGLQARAQEFRGVAAQVEQCSVAEQAMRRVETLTARVSRLRSLLTDLKVAEGVLARAVVPEVPTANQVSRAQDRLLHCYTLLSTVSISSHSAQVSEQKMQEAEQSIQQWHETLHQTLLDAGVCPTCQRSMKEL